GHRSEENRRDGDRHGDDGAAQKRAADVEPQKELPVLIEGGRVRHEVRRKRGRFPIRHERRREHPQQRKKSQEAACDEDGVQNQRFAPPAHCFSRNRICTSVAAPMMRKSTNATAAAYPIRQNLKPCSYIIMTIVSVLLSGPPLVMTYGSAKICSCPIATTTPTKRNVGPSIGSVTCRNCRHIPAPSNRAASYNSSGTF